MCSATVGQTLKREISPIVSLMFNTLDMLNGFRLSYTRSHNAKLTLTNRAFLPPITSVIRLYRIEHLFRQMSLGSWLAGRVD